MFFSKLLNFLKSINVCFSLDLPTCNSDLVVPEQLLSAGSLSQVDDDSGSLDGTQIVQLCSSLLFFSCLHQR